MTSRALDADMPSPAVISMALRGPRIRELSARQITCVLGRNTVARVGFLREGRMEIAPVHYVLEDGVLYGRTASGTKSRAWRTRSSVVVEVDEVDDLFNWRSVVIHGAMDIVRAVGPRAESYAYWKAVSAIRRLVPSAFTERDPMPYRTHVFRIIPAELTGRQAVGRLP